MVQLKTSPPCNSEMIAVTLLNITVQDYSYYGQYVQHCSTKIWALKVVGDDSLAHVLSPSKMQVCQVLRDIWQKKPEWFEQIPRFCEYPWWWSKNEGGPYQLGAVGAQNSTNKKGGHDSPQLSIDEDIYRGPHNSIYNDHRGSSWTILYLCQVTFFQSWAENCSPTY